MSLQLLLGHSACMQCVRCYKCRT